MTAHEIARQFEICAHVQELLKSEVLQILPDQESTDYWDFRSRCDHLLPDGSPAWRPQFAHEDYIDECELCSYTLWEQRHAGT